MILEEHLRFIVLNAMLNGHKDDEIMKTLSLSQDGYAQLIGFSTFEEYHKIAKNLKYNSDTTEVERLLINLFSLDYYCCSFLTREDGSHSIITVNMLRDEFLKEPYPVDLLKRILMDMLPEVKTGDCLKAQDGVLTIPSKFSNKFESLCISAFKKYAYGDGILTRAVFKDIALYFDITSYKNINS